MQFEINSIKNYDIDMEDDGDSIDVYVRDDNKEGRVYTILSIDNDGRVTFSPEAVKQAGLFIQ